MCASAMLQIFPRNKNAFYYSFTLVIGRDQEFSSATTFQLKFQPRANAAQKTRFKFCENSQVLRKTQNRAKIASKQSPKSPYLQYSMTFQTCVRVDQSNKKNTGTDIQELTLLTKCGKL